MKKGDLLFVYGTLRRGERASLGDGFYGAGTAFIGKDEVNGEIFDLGSYPGAMVVGDYFDPKKPRVVGDVFRIKDASIVALLDAYEGYPDLYSRCETKSERGRTVWVYTYNYLENMTLNNLIPSGDWCNKHKSAVVDSKKPAIPPQVGVE